jgi:hypothetical protein
MKPDMPNYEMLNSFVFIAHGSRVIDRKERDWRRADWLHSEKYIRKNMVYTVADLKRFFAHRVVKSKWTYERRDPFNDWLKDPRKFTAATLAEAIDFADAAARGNVEPRIDIESIIQNGLARAKAIKPPPPPWQQHA